MPIIDTTDVVSYGFAMLGYAIVLALVAGVFVWGGSHLMAGARLGVGPRGMSEVRWLQFLAGTVFRFVGVVTLFAGALGLLYKVVADGVSRGNLAAR